MMISSGGKRRLAALLTALCVGTTSLPLAAEKSPATNAGGKRIEAKECRDCPGRENGEGKQWKNSLCSLRYIVYFLWFVVTGVIGVVILIMDLTTLFTQGLLRNYVEWVRDKTQSLFRFFEAIGCS